MIEMAAGGRWQVAFSFAPVFLDVALKSVLVLLLALAVAGCMRKSSAAARHLVWFLAVASLVALPILSVELPGWHILPQWLSPQLMESPQPIPPPRAEPVGPQVQQVETGPTEIARPSKEFSQTPSVPRTERIETPPVQLPPRTTEPTRPTTSEPLPVPVSPRDYWMWAWILGVALALVPVALGSFSLWRLGRSSRRESGASWMDLLRNLVACLHFRGTAALLKTHRRRMPMTWGILRTKLLLPEESDEWTGDRRRVVLLHELAHAKRWDYLTNLVTQLVCAIYWFNPLVWIAARRMVIERERACDDIVLRHGAKPADYAEQLLQIAAGLRLNRFAAIGGIPMARPSKLEERLRAILDGTRNRAALTRMVVIASVVLFTAIVVPVAMIRAASGEQRPGAKSVRERIEQLMQSVPGTTNVADLEIYDPAGGYQIRSDVVRLPFQNEDDSANLVLGYVLDLPAKKRFYLQWSKLGGDSRYYGPFEGDPFHVLGSTNRLGKGWIAQYPLINRQPAEPDNPLGLDDDAIVRFFKTGTLLEQVARMATPQYGWSGGTARTVEELYANYINRDEVGNDPFSSGKLRLERLPGKLRVWSVGPDGVWDGGKVIDSNDPVLRGDLGVELIEGAVNVSWFASGAVLEYLQGKHTARYLAKKGTHYPVHFPLPTRTNGNLTFGPMVDGLRAAVELIATNGDFPIGQPIPVRFHIRNESDYAIQIASESDRQGDELILETEAGDKVLNEDGVPVMISTTFYTGWSAIRRQVLKPGEEITVEAHAVAFFNDNGYTTADQPFPIGHAVHTKPGRYVIRFRLHFSGWNAQLMDWKGELETGPTTIDVKERAASPARTNEQSSAKPDTTDALILTGKVIDAETGQAIPDFTVTPGYIGSPGPDPLLWARDRLVQGRAGAYRLELSSNAPNAFILVEAAGYAPQMTQVGTNHTGDFVLRRSNGVDGTVTDAKGNPVRRASVAFALSHSVLTLRPESLPNMGQLAGAYPHRSPITYTDGEGRFHLPAMAGVHSLVAVDRESGFVESPSDDIPHDGILRLQPWARIEGTLFQNGKPLTNEVIGLALKNPTLRGFKLDEVAYQTNTDSGGRFVFENVPAGEFDLYRQMGGRYAVVGRGNSFSMTDFIETGGRIERRYFTNIVNAEKGNTVTLELDTSQATPRPGEPGREARARRQFTESPEIQPPMGDLAETPVRIVSIGGRLQGTDRWWNTDGKEMTNFDWPPRNELLCVILDRGSLEGELAGVFRTPGGQKLDVRRIGVTVGHYAKWFVDDASEDGRRYVDSGGRVDFVVQHGVGPWQEIATIREGQTNYVDGNRFVLRTVRPATSGRTHVDASFDYDPAYEIALVAVTRDGVRSPVPQMSRAGFNTSREDRQFWNTLEMDYSRIDHFAILKRPLKEFVFQAIPTRPAASANSARTNSQSSESLVTSAATNVPPLERTVSLDAKQMPLKDVFAEVCRQVNLKLELDTAGLEKVHVSPDSPVSVSFTNEPLTYAIIGILRRFQDRMLFWELRGETLFVGSAMAPQVRATPPLPEWLKPLQGRGVHAEVDAAGNVISLFAGDKATDEFLANARTLPKLRELRIQGVKDITLEGLAHLGELRALEKLQLWSSMPQTNAGWGDEALRQVSRIKTLRDLEIDRCGVTDSGARTLETMSQLRSLNLSGNRLTSAALRSLAGLTNLQKLDLGYGVSGMELQQLSGLTQLEELSVFASGISGRFVAFPRLRVLSVSGERFTDADFDAIVQCRELRRLDIAGISDAGLRRIAELPELRQLDVGSEAITVAGIAHLKASPKLERLSIRTRQNDEAVRHLSEIKSLVELTVYGPRWLGLEDEQGLTVEGLLQLKKLPKLRTLEIYGIQAATGVLGLRELTQLQTLTLNGYNVTEQELDLLKRAMPGTYVGSMFGGRSFTLAGEQPQSPPPPLPSASVFLSGRVVDDATGEAVTNGVIEFGAADPDKPGEVIWGAALSEPKMEVSGNNPADLSQFWGECFRTGKVWARILAGGRAPELLTPSPVESPVRLTNLVVRMQRGGDLRGVVVDHTGNPVPGMRVYLADQRLFTLSRGTPGSLSGDNNTTTDTNGRFALPGGDGTEQRVVAASPDGQLFAVAPRVGPAREVRISLPQPATLIVRYDIPDDSPVARIGINYETQNLDPVVWKEMSFGLAPTVTNGQEIVLTNLTPGTYRLMRRKTAMLGNRRGGGGVRGAILDMRTLTLEAGQTQRVDIVRTRGHSIRGEVMGLRATGAPGASIYAFSAQTTNDLAGMLSGRPRPIDLVTCSNDGLFVIGRLEPGAYTIVAVVERDLDWGVPRTRPDYAGTAEVNINADGPPPEPLKIELLPWAVATNKPGVQLLVSPQPISTARRPAGNTGTDWGDPVEGVQVRLHAQRTRWATNESQELLVDVANHGASRFHCPTNYHFWDVEVDGRWYGRIFGARWGWGPQSTEGPDAGETVTNVPFSLGAKGDSLFALGKSDLQWLKLTPGKHIVRVRIDGGVDQSRPIDLQATSNPLEIDIAEAATTSPRASDEHDATSGWGEAANGLRTRVWAETNVFRSGQPIPLKLEVTNVTDAARSFQTPAAPWNSSLTVLDSRGKPVPYIAGSSQVGVPPIELVPHHSIAPNSFDLTDYYYVRRLGRYMVIWTNEVFLPGPDNRVMPLPPAAPFTFDVVPDLAANAEDDPIGKLLPLLKDHWSIGTGGSRTNRLRPGSNRQEVAGRLITLQYNPTGYKADSGLVWLWLTDEYAGEERASGDWPPPSEQLGHLSRWLGYFNVSTNALRAWPTVREDIIEAFTGIGARLHLHARRTHWTTNETPELLVDISNFGKVPFDFPTNSSGIVLELDDRWYSGTDAGGSVVHSGRSNPGEVLTNFTILFDTSAWVPSLPFLSSEMPQLAPGKHIIRLRYPVWPSDDHGGIVHLLSDPLEIEITATDSVLPSALGSPEPTQLQSRQSPDTTDSRLVTGKIIDAESRLPIPDFTVTVGNMGAPDYLGWNRSGAVSGSAGTYQIEVVPGASYPWLLVEAPGYAAEMQSIRTNRILNVELRKDAGLKGRVLGPNGQAVEGASVAYRVIGSSLLLQKSELTNWFWEGSSIQHSPIVRTDGAGRFLLPAKAGRISVFASHKQGFVEVPLEDVVKSGLIQLKPWGRIEGTLRSADRLTNNYVQLSIRDSFKRGFALDAADSEAMVESSGSFVFEWVPPGEYDIGHLIGGHHERISPGSYAVRGSEIRIIPLAPVPIKVEAGKTNVVDFHESPELRPMGRQTNDPSPRETNPASAVQSAAGPDEVPRNGPALAEFSGHVVDDTTGAPVSNIVLQVGTANPQKPDEIQWSQQFLGPWQGKPGFFSVQTENRWQTWRVLVDGYLPERVVAPPNSPSASANDLVIRLKRGGELRGVVFDYTGRPVPDAKVILNRYQTTRITNSRAEVVFGGSSAITDSAGRFRLEGVAANESNVVVMSPGLQLWSISNAVPGRELSITLPRPAALAVHYSIAGDSADTELELDLMNIAAGQALGWDALSNEPKHSIHNGGWLTVTNLPPGDYFFSRMKRLDVDDVHLGVTIDRTKFRLESGQSNSIELVRSHGYPVRGEVVGLTNLEASGALIFVRAAGADVDLGVPSDIFRENVDALTCGKNGQFQTASLEPGAYTVTIGVYRPETPAESFSFRGGIRLPAYIGSANVIVSTNTAPPPVTIELHARVPAERPNSANDLPHVRTNAESSPKPGTAEAPVIIGEVIDVETRQPIRDFTVTPGGFAASDILPWRSQDSVRGTNGIFRIPRPGMDTFKIEAPGYMPEMIGQYRLETNEVVQLHRGEFVTGRVLGVDGRPVVGAQVALHLARTEIHVSGINLRSYLSMIPGIQSSPITTTDARGESKLPAGPGMNALIAASGDGFAYAKLDHYENSKTIQLEPWGRVAGTLAIGDQPGAGKSVRIMAGDYVSGRLGVAWAFDTNLVTDAEGHFAYEKVPPGEAEILFEAPGLSYFRQFQVKPGSILNSVIAIPGEPWTNRAPRIGEQIAWGPETNGLQFGISSDDISGPRAGGEKVTVNFWLRNNRQVSTDATNYVGNWIPMLFDGEGKPIARWSQWPSVLMRQSPDSGGAAPMGSRVRLEAGQSLRVGVGTVEFPEIPAGRYLFRNSYEADIDGRHVPALTSGELPIQIESKSTDGGLNKAAPQSREQSETGSNQRGPEPSSIPPSAKASPAQSNHQSSIINHQSSQSLVTSAATNLDGSVEGVSLRLQVVRSNGTVRSRWATNETPTLTFDLQNQGRRDFNTFQLQELAQLEVDGIWYEWTGSGVWTHSPLLPGTKYEVNPVELTPDWRPKQSSASSFGPRPPLSLSPGKHSVRLAVRCFDPDAPVSKMLVTNAASSEIVVTSNPVEIEITDSAAASVEPIWLSGYPVGGVGINLIEGHYAWTDEDVVGLSVGFQISVAEKIPKPGDPVPLSPFSPSPNELEVDGILYHWTGDYRLMSSAFPPARLASGCLPVSLTTNWQTGDGVPLRLTPARHTVRVASTGTETDSDGNSPIRAISNPVQINVSPGTGWRSALVKKYLPGYLFRAVRRQIGNRESMVEVLVVPSGEEIDLAAARGQWRGITSVLPPAGSAFFDFPTYWHNAQLTALAPSLNLKIATSQDAEEVSRLILGLFKGWTSFEAWTTQAESSENGWVVTPRYIGPPTQLPYQGPLELILENGFLKDVRQGAGMPPRQASIMIEDANAAEAGWGESVEGLSIRLQSDKDVWYLANDAPTLRLSVRNLGTEALAVPESQELGELEVDGVWYTWSDKYFVAHKTLPQGRQMENLAVLASSRTWRKDSTPLFAGAGKHRVRFAVIARRGTGLSAPTFRAVSNPVEVEFRMGVAPKEGPAPAPNTPSTNAPSATASPAQSNLQSSILHRRSSESLVTSAATNVLAHRFTVTGRVSDEQGKGLAGVTIRAHSGVGTLHLTGETNTDANGYYTLHFAEGMHSISDGTNPPRVMLQAATISAGKPGFSETNLNRGGDLLMADRLPAPGEDSSWKVDSKRVVLADHPYELNFAMHPAARVVGLLFDKTGQPMRKTRLWIDGEQLPPSCNILAETETDSGGEFRFDDVPTGFLWRFNVSGKAAQGIRFDQAGEHSIVFSVDQGVTEIPQGQPAARVIPVHQRINGLPEKGVRRYGKLLSDSDLALLRIHEQFHGWGSPPLVTDTNTLRVLATTTNSEVSVGESFPVELRIQNTTTNKVSIYVMSCSWYDQWVTTEPLIDWERWPCFANYPELVELAPGRFCPIVLKVFVTERPPGGKLAFRLGFIQGNAFPQGILSFFWSNEITVTVKDGSQTHVPAGAASPKGNANQSQSKQAPADNSKSAGGGISVLSGTVIDAETSGSAPMIGSSSRGAISPHVSNTNLYAAGFAPEKSEITLGEPIYLEFSLTNTGNRAILLAVGGHQWSLAGPYRIQAFDAHGTSAVDLYGNGMFVGGGVVGVTAIEPGQTFIDRLYLPTFIRFERPGEYTVVATRRIGIYEETTAVHRTMNGAINDNLHWVNTIDDEMRSFEIPSARLVGSRFTITNTFKLTVLPADRERLLKRARELAARLDVIGAEDLRANPHPPRPLDLKANWEAMTTAYWTGKNNEDLRWAVKEISEIGDRRVIPELKQLLAHPNMRIRFAAVKMLCAFGEPLRPEWIVPVIKSERWTVNDDPETFAKDHGGTNTASIMIQCLDMTNPSATNRWNSRLLFIIRSTGNPELNLPYHHDENVEGTPQQVRENVATLQKLQDWLKLHPPVISEPAPQTFGPGSSSAVASAQRETAFSPTSHSAIGGAFGLRVRAAGSHRFILDAPSDALRSGARSIAPRGERDDRTAV